MFYTHLLKTENDYEQALSRIDEIFDAAPDTPEADEFELLVALVELYEKEHYPIETPDPVSAIKFRMEQEGLQTLIWKNILAASRKFQTSFLISVA